MLAWRQNSWGLSSGDRPRRQHGRRQHAPCEARHSIKGDLPATNWRDPAAQQQELGLRHLHQFLRQQEGAALIGFRHAAIGQQPMNRSAARFHIHREEAEPLRKLVRDLQLLGREHHLKAAIGDDFVGKIGRAEEHTSELQSLMRISYAVFCLKKKKTQKKTRRTDTINTKNEETL